MTDQFRGLADDVDNPARQMFLITPHATNEIDPLPKAIRADSAGTVALRAQYVRVTGTTVLTLHGLG